MSKKYGLTQTGYKTKPFDVMLSEVEANLVAALGAINLTPPSVFSVLINTFLMEVAKVDLKGEEIYNSTYPNTATGYSLDGIADYNGIKRLVATHSTVTAQVLALNYTNIQSGSEAVIENTNQIFLSADDVTVSNEQCNAIEIEVINNTLTEYKVIINNVQYVYEKEAFETTADIAAGLKLQLDTIDGLTVKRVDSVLVISSMNHLVSFSCFMTDEIIINLCQMNVDFVAKESGGIVVPERSLNLIQTPIAGWVSVNNLTAGVSGRGLETDIELRIRRRGSIRFSGSGTVESMKARLLNLVGVTSVKILENITDIMDINGLPPKSFEVLILGGLDAEIAHMIWLVKPVGIQSVGNTELVTLDSGGNQQIVHFSRSIKVHVFVKVIITPTNDFAPESINHIRQNIVDQILKAGLGSPIIYQSLFASVFSVDGISNALLTIGGSLIETNIPPLISANINVLPSQICTSDINKITIEVLP